MSSYDLNRVIDRLLRQHEAGIKMYLACRLGGAEQLADVYAEVQRALARGSAAELEKAPSLPAFAYGIARRTASTARGPDDPPGLENVPWGSTPERDAAGYAEALDRIRTELAPESSEALELHYARGLGFPDLAYVTGVDEAAARARVDAGARQVDQIVATLEPRPELAELLGDAFHARTSAEPADAGRLQARPPRLPEGSVVGGRFEVASSPQVSSVASVYLVNDTSVPGQKVVLHLLHRVAPSTAARAGMLRKVRLLGSVVHASVGRVVDYGWQADRLWYTTPWYEGHTLDALAAQRALSPDEAIDIFVPLAQALAALHEHGVVHRDIAPETTLVLRVGSQGAYQTLPVLTGFDAWVLGEPSADDEPRSIAPEVAGRLSAGQPAPAPSRGEDVFALGYTLLQCLAPDPGVAREPWPSFVAKRAREPVSIVDNPRTRPFARLLERALAIDPDARPSAAEMAEALEAAKPKIAAKRARRSLVLPVSVVLAVVGLLLVGLFLRQSRLRLIQETLDVAEAQELRDELEAERARSKALEQRPSMD